jgi:hypothetical protein
VSGARSLLRVEYLLPFAVAASAVCVGVSEFMDTFQFDLGTSGEPQRTVAAADRHHYALLVLALFALFALAIAVIGGSRPAAIAVAVAGGISLLFFLVVDLPDVGQQGSLDEPSRVFFSSEAEPSGGFWLELVGTLGLAVSGGALAPRAPRAASDARPALRGRSGGAGRRRGGPARGQAAVGPRGPHTPADEKQIAPAICSAPAGGGAAKRRRGGEAPMHSHNWQPCSLAHASRHCRV